MTFFDIINLMKCKYIPARKRSAYQKAIAVNNITYTNYLQRLERVALSMFKWENLPKSMNERWLEWCLYSDGQAALIEDETLGFMNTQVTTANKLNIYHLPTEIHCYGIEYNKVYKTYFGNEKIEENERPNYGVLVKNDVNGSPTLFLMQMFAERLTDVQRTIDVNIKQQKTPYIIITDDNQRLTMENVIEQIDSNVVAVFGKKNTLITDGIRTINTGSPYIADKLHEMKINIWNEALTTLGINNLKEKKERLVADEAITNNEIINLNLQAYLAPRELACEQFNQLFGLTGDKAIRVKVRSDLQNIIKQAESIVKDYKDEVLNSEVDNE